MVTATRPAELIRLYNDPEVCASDRLEAVPLVEERAFAVWQKDIPDPYLSLSAEELDARIASARARLGSQLTILGHHYQRDEVIKYADFTGDSFKLSQQAAAQKDVRYVVFCGVHFMAESADLLTEPEVRVILPNMAAGCSMADMADPDDVFACWDDLTELLGDDIVPVTYMNSAASLKAFCGEHGGIVCTSSNAPKVLQWAYERGSRVLFFPDEHLGRNTGVKLGIGLDEMAVWNYRLPDGGASEESLRRSKLVLWQGYCTTHQRFNVRQIEQARAANPKVNIVVHPECRYEVVQAADYDGSTEVIIKTVNAAAPGTSWGVGTEINLVNRLARANPDKEVFCLDPVVCPCSTMYRIHPAYLAWVLEGLVAGHVVNEIRVDDETRHWARTALERMLAVA